MAMFLKVVGFVAILGGVYLSLTIKKSIDGTDYGMICLVAGVVQGCIVIAFGMMLEKLDTLLKHFNLTPQQAAEQELNEVTEP